MDIAWYMYQDESKSSEASKIKLCMEWNGKYGMLKIPIFLTAREIKSAFFCSVL